MNESELKQLALDISEGKVFGSWMIPTHQLDTLLPLVFMPLAFGAYKTIKDEDVSALYEYLDKAGSRAIDGYPMFTSAKMLSKGDLDRLIPMLEKLQNMKKEFLKESSDV